MKDYMSSYLSLFFDVIKPNTTYNVSLNRKRFNDRLGRIVLVRGRVDKGTLIISKGEVVQVRNWLF